MRFSLHYESFPSSGKWLTPYWSIPSMKINDESAVDFIMKQVNAAIKAGGVKPQVSKVEFDDVPL
jgi:hypothetical protein